MTDIYEISSIPKRPDGDKGIFWDICFKVMCDELSYKGMDYVARGHRIVIKLPEKEK